MSEKLFLIIDKLLLESYSSSLINGSNWFDILISKMEAYHNRPCHSLHELRLINTKERGSLFECFCVRFLQRIKLVDAWLLLDTPKEILQHLNLKRRDIGIDIIAYNKEKNLYYAIQAKHRSNRKTYKGKSSVSWKDLSTFYSLVSRTGPWSKHIVMTDADFVRHQGYKLLKDISWCYQSFANLSIENQAKLVDIQEHKLSDTVQDKPTIELLRELRLKKLQK